MVKKTDLKQNVKVKQKQNVNVRVHIDQRDLKKKPRQKRSKLPSAKKEGVSSFSTGFTPVYIQSGNPYPNYPQAPEIQPIRKTPVSQEVHTLVNPPVTSTTNINEEIKKTPLKSHTTSPKNIFPLNNEMNENRTMGNEDVNVAYRRLPTNIQNGIRESSNNMDIVEIPSNNMDIVEIPSNDIAVPRVKRKYTKKNEMFWLNKKYRRDGGL